MSHETLAFGEIFFGGRAAMHPARKLVNLTMVVRILVVAHHNHNELWNFFVSSLFI
jgi:hypothetical protein